MIASKNRKKLKDVNVKAICFEDLGGSLFKHWTFVKIQNLKIESWKRCQWGGHLFSGPGRQPFGIHFRMFWAPSWRFKANAGGLGGLVEVHFGPCKGLGGHETTGKGSGHIYIYIYTILYYIISYHIMLYDIISYCIMLHYIILYHII